MKGTPRRLVGWLMSLSAELLPKLLKSILTADVLLAILKPFAEVLGDASTRLKGGGMIQPAHKPPGPAAELELDEELPGGDVSGRVPGRDAQPEPMEIEAVSVLALLAALGSTPRFAMAVAFFSKAEVAVAASIFAALGNALTPAEAPTLGATRRLYKL
jgi:hypothetical protein